MMLSPRRALDQLVHHPMQGQYVPNCFWSESTTQYGMSVEKSGLALNPHASALRDRGGANA